MNGCITFKFHYESDEPLGVVYDEVLRLMPSKLFPTPDVPAKFYSNHHHIAIEIVSVDSSAKGERRAKGGKR
jgi:hypothetical protein